MSKHLGEQGKTVAVYIPSRLADWTKEQASKKGISISRVVTEALEAARGQE